jgi:hypothetical protein
MDKLIKKILGDNKNYNHDLDKPPKKQKVFNKFNSNMPQIEGLNFQCDLLFLPTTDENYKYLFVITDVANHKFDIEPMKNKNSSDTKNALVNILKRKYIKKPSASIRTDSGSEFKGEFDDYLNKTLKIFHSVAMVKRHSQMSIVESLNKQLGKIIMTYLNTIENETGEIYNEWTDILDDIRKYLNEHRQIKLPTFKNYIENLELFPVDFYKLQKQEGLKIGDIVRYALNYPESNINSLKYHGEKFRNGDRRWSLSIHKIVDILYMQDEPYIRYMISDINNASFTKEQLMKTTEKEKKYIIKEIIGKKKLNNKTYYLIWWKGYLKKDSTWGPENELLKDGLKNYIDEYNK